MGTDKYHIQVNHHLRVGKNALDEYDQYAIYLAILYHGAIDMEAHKGVVSGKRTASIKATAA